MGRKVKQERLEGIWETVEQLLFSPPKGLTQAGIARRLGDRSMGSRAKCMTILRRYPQRIENFFYLKSNLFTFPYSSKNR